MSYVNPFVEVFDDVILRLSLAVEREEALLAMADPDEWTLADADSATQAAMDALQHAVTEPTGAQPEVRALAAVLHTLNMAWLVEDARDRAWALDAAMRHPSFAAENQDDPGYEVVGHRVDQLRDLVERLWRLTAEPSDEPSPDLDGPSF